MTTAWSAVRRPRIIEDTALSCIVQELGNEVGRSNGQREVSKTESNVE